MHTKPPRRRALLKAALLFFLFVPALCWTLVRELPVGAEPTSIAVRNNAEAWVTNWLSDSVSIVDLNAGNVTKTIDVGDEPTDVVFAGAQQERAFVCVSGLRQIKVFNPNTPDVV